MPIFKDEKTPSPFIEEDFGDPDAKQAIKPDHIYMDAMGFGKFRTNVRVELFIFMNSRYGSGWLK